MSVSEQLELFDRWWRNVDRLYGAFQGLDFDIEAFRDEYRPEIEAGVSRGRFAAIMNHFGYRLQDLVSELALRPDAPGPLRPLLDLSRRIAMIVGLVARWVYSS